MSAEEATAWFREASNETAQALMVESVAVSLWQFMNSRAEWWG
jgi:hypothetical protein